MNHSFHFLFVVLLTLSGCVSTAGSVPYGAQSGEAGFVPARTAIFPCRVWPAGARYKALPLSSLTEPSVAELCAKFDGYVLEGFNSQPYMKAFSPKFVVKALDTAKVETADSAINRLWTHRADSGSVTNPPAYYVGALVNRPEWQLWLSTLSAAARNADAILLPFILYGDERHYDDRGLQVAERSAGVAMLLISTADGALIWAGGREATVPVKRLSVGGAAEAAVAPPWENVLERLFTEDLWREYPGRQVF